MGCTISKIEKKSEDESEDESSEEPLQYISPIEKSEKPKEDYNTNIAEIFYIEYKKQKKISLQK